MPQTAEPRADTAVKEGRPEILRDDVGIPRQNLDVNGLVLVWEFAAKRWRRCAPIDARELIGKGLASLTGPKDESRPEPVRDTTKPPSEDDLRREFGGLSKQALRLLCDQHGAAYAGTDKKDQLIDALLAAGATPGGATLA